MDKLHHSKLDNWLLMAIVTSALLVLLAATLLALSGLVLIALLVFILGAVVPMWVVMATRYHIIEDELRIRAGPFRWRIKLDDIQDLTPCHNSVLAPAMSAQRLKLVYLAGKGHKAGAKTRFQLYISPEDRYQFIVDLGIADPQDADEDDGHSQLGLP